MTREVRGNNTWETASRNDAMGQHVEEIDCWTPECCMKRISSGCCPCRFDPELEEIRRDKIMADWLSDIADEEPNSDLYDADIYESLPEDESEAPIDPYDNSCEIQF